MSLRPKLITLVAVLACAVLAGPQPATAAKKKTRTVDGTLTLAVIASSGNVNEFVGRQTGKGLSKVPAVVGEATLTATPMGLIIESRSRLYGKKGTVRVNATDVGTAQPDGSLSLEGTYKITGGTGKYKGATGRGSFDGTLPPGTIPGVGLVETFELRGNIRF